MSLESRKLVKKKTPKDKDEFIKNLITKWRNIFSIDTDLNIDVKYVAHREGDDETLYAATYVSMAQYGKVTIEIFDEVINSKDFEKEAESTIIHELLHVALHPLIAYCDNMFTGDDGKKKELERLEDHVITRIEKGLVNI